MKEQLSRLRYYLQRHFLLYLGISILLALLLSLVFNLLTPQRQKVSRSEFVVTNYDNSNTTFRQVTYSGAAMELPEQLPVYQPASEQNAEEIAQTIISNFQLTPLEKMEGYWTSTDKALIKRSLENKYALYDYAAQNASDAATLRRAISSEQAIEVCDLFFQNASTATLLPAVDNIEYLSLSLEPQPVSPDQAQILIIPYSHSLDSYPLYYANENDFPFYCRVTNQYQISQVVFKDFFYSFAQVGQLDSISVDQAVRNIKDGQASIISAGSKIADVFDLSWIKQAELTELKLVYRYDPDLRLAYPFYQFSGILTNNDGLNLRAIVITPAVLSQTLR